MKRIICALCMLVLAAGVAWAQEVPTVMSMAIGNWKIRCISDGQDPRLSDCVATAMARAKPDPHFIVRVIVGLNEKGVMRAVIEVPAPSDTWFEDTRPQHVVLIEGRHFTSLPVALTLTKELCQADRCSISWSVYARELYKEEKDTGFIFVTAPVDVGLKYGVHMPINGFGQVFDVLRSILDRNHSIINQGAE